MENESIQLRSPDLAKLWRDNDGDSTLALLTVNSNRDRAKLST